MQTPYGTVKGEYDENFDRWFIHFEYTDTSFTKKKYLAMLDAWASMLTELKELHGVQNVYSCINKKDTKIQKFQTMFGLAPIEEGEDFIIFKGGL